MIKTGFKTIACIFVLGLFFLPSAQTMTINVTGMVVDSVSKSPDSGAMILLYADTALGIDTNNLGSLKLDTAYSGKNGKFQHQMIVSSKSILIVYSVLKLGYKIKYNISVIAFSQGNLGTIQISQIDTTQKAVISVTGKVVDSGTGRGFGGALVAMSTGGGFDTIGNTVLTNSDGTFFKQVTISKLNGASIVAYVITDLGYQTQLGQNQASGSQLDLGTIQLKKNGSAIKPEIGSFAPVQINKLNVYSLNGQLLYEGKAQAIGAILRNYRGGVIVAIKYDNARVATIKYTPIK
jgi:hypothetical protein